VIAPSQTKREIGLSALQNLFERPFQQHFAVAKPIVPIAKSLNACLTSHCSLHLPHFGHTKIIEAQVGWNTWLVVTAKQWPCLGNIGPLCKAFPPNGIILGDGMELWEVICYNARFHSLDLFIIIKNVQRGVFIVKLVFFILAKIASTITWNMSRNGQMGHLPFSEHTSDGVRSII
jgi:hypothetical protein